MGALYSPGDFPTLEEMTQSMEHSFSFLPLPDAANILVENASESEIQQLRANAEREIEARFNADGVELRDERGHRIIVSRVADQPGLTLCGKSFR